VERRLAGRAPALRGAALAAQGLAAAAPALPGLLPGAYQGATQEHVLALLSRLRDDPAARPGAVLGPWDLGHHVLAAAGRPVVTSPFGTEGGAGAMEDGAAFDLATDERATAAILARRGVAYVLSAPPTPYVAVSQRLAGVSDLVTRPGGPLAGYHYAVADRFNDLVVVRLYYGAGVAARGLPGPALGGFRLVDEAARPGGALPDLRLFEVVPGLRLRVRAPPGRRVTARTALQAPVAGTVPWLTVVDPGPDGVAELRLPFSAGWNGRVQASPFLVTDGDRVALLSPTEAQVRAGATVELTLPGGR
jgi:hypothetical protein